MTDLPVCKLCNSTAEPHETCVGIKHCCSNQKCTLNRILTTRQQWRKLMHVPDKKHGPLDDEAVGYNQAIDDMLRGGE